MSHSEDHDHDHDHTAPPPELELRVKALESLLIEKGLVDPATLNEIIDTYEHRVGPRNGAQVVAKAWADEKFRQALLNRCNRGGSKPRVYGASGRTSQGCRELG